MNYFERLRHKYISDFIKKNGYINRSDIMEEFGISMPQASIDLTKWKAANPDVIEYNYRKRQYETIRTVCDKVLT